MRIRTSFRILSSVSVLVIVVMLASTTLFYLRLRRAVSFEQFLNGLQKNQQERVLLRDDCLLREKQNAYHQWLAKSEVIAGQVDALKKRPLAADDRALVERIGRTYRVTRALLPRILDLRRDRAGVEPIRLNVVAHEKRLASQLILNAYLLSDSIGFLLQSARRETILARDTLLLVFGLSTLMLASTVTMTVVYAKRTLLKGISALETGTELVAAGRLDYQIPVEGNHELSDLARQFNGMADRVRHSYQSLEFANRELEGFSYSVSHDLRTSLRHVIAYSERLRERNLVGLDDASRHDLEVICAGANRMGQLVDDLLAYTRTGNAEMVKKVVQLDEVVALIRLELETAAAGRFVRWVIRPLPAVSGDESMLRLVLQNLLANALKFTSRCPEAVIEVGSRFVDSETVIFVRDNGAGFDMRYADKLFGLFRRLHRTDEFEGTGVGLANVKRIIHRHGGRVWAEGQVDHGATFYFSLPAG